MAVKRNKDGVVEPVKIEKSYAETLPTAAEQRPVEDEWQRKPKDEERESGKEEEKGRKPIGKD